MLVVFRKDNNESASLTCDALTLLNKSLRVNGRLNRCFALANFTDIFCLQTFLSLVDFKLYLSVLVQNLEALVGNDG